LNVDFISHTIGVIFQKSAIPVAAIVVEPPALLDYLTAITIGASNTGASEAQRRKATSTRWDGSSLRDWASRKGEGIFLDYWNLRFGLRRCLGRADLGHWLQAAGIGQQNARTRALESAMAADIAFL
jgi:hypothetical protein